MKSNDPPNDPPSDLQRFRSFFGNHIAVPQQDLLNELYTQFEIGSNPDELATLQRQQLNRYLGELERHYVESGKPALSEIFKERFEKILESMSLDLVPSKFPTSYSLSETERADFSYFGILPPHRLETVSEDQLRKIEATLDQLAFASPPIQSSVAYLFCPALLDLALNEEILDRVCSILGDEITFLGTSGPMYKSPQSQDPTPWHNASAQTFGGGNQDSNLDLVTCWIALSDTTVENGCMKMIPRSFAFNNLKREILQWDGSVTRTPAGLFNYLMNHPYKFDLATIQKMFCRRWMAPRIESLYFLEGQPPEKRYNPFQSSVDTALLIGKENLERMSTIDGTAMPAVRGEMYSFTSQNSHASFANTTGHWRKAIALRYAKTGSARPNIADNSFELLTSYTKKYPATVQILEKAGKTLGQFEAASPRLCARGKIPEDQRHLYFDASTLRSALQTTRIF